MVTAVTRVLGIHNLALAEDVVQDAFCRALEVWPFRGYPENPSAWLMAAAKNRMLDVVRRERTARTFAPELGRLLESEWTLRPTIEEAFEPGALRDDLLRMMFSCCHPRLGEEAQVALMLHILCGFSVPEIAGAFVATRSAVEKRIARAKQVLAGSIRLFDVLPGDELATRLPAVQRTIYLLFNEGYHGASTETAVRAELCAEAMRLAAILRQNPLTAIPSTFALSALLCLHAARLPGRVDTAGELQSLFDQDRTKWNYALVAEGENLLERSASGNELTEYHVEAAIAWIHAKARGRVDTDWRGIVRLYDQLMTIRPSPIVALNRAIAVAQLEGPDRGIEAIQSIVAADRLTSYPFYFAALGELESQAGRPEIAGRHFKAALGAARSPIERRFFAGRLRACTDLSGRHETLPSQDLGAKG